MKKSASPSSSNGCASTSSKPASRPPRRATSSRSRPSRPPCAMALIDFESIKAIAHGGRDGLDRLEVALRGGREAGFDDVDAQPFELLGDADFFILGHRGAGRLLAVAQRGVEDDEAVGRVTHDGSLA